MEYGEGSLMRHMSKAAAAGHHAGLLNVPGIAFDIDTPEDLCAFCDDPPKDGKDVPVVTVPVMEAPQGPQVQPVPPAPLQPPASWVPVDPPQQTGPRLEPPG